MGSSTNAPVSLAPFAFDWVGGDIHGLQRPVVVFDLDSEAWAGRRHPIRRARRWATGRSLQGGQLSTHELGRESAIRRAGDNYQVP